MLRRSSLIVIVVMLIVILTGCSRVHGVAYAPVTTVPESQQTAPGPTTASPTGVQQNSTSQTEKFTLSPIVLYSTQLKPGNNEFPNYELGNVQIEPIMSYQDWVNRGGHQPWRRDPFSIVQVLTFNLIPENISNNSSSKWTESINMATDNNGVVIKLISPVGDSLHNSSNATGLTYQMIVPHLGSYDVTVQQPQGSVFFFITKIVFSPNSTI